MRSVRRAASAVLLWLAAAACDDPLGPLADLGLYVSATPDQVQLGDTIQLIGVANNPSDRTIPAGAGCGPGIGFTVTDSAGVETDLYAGLAFSCPVSDSNEIRAGETDVVEWEWSPSEPGLYQVRSHVKLRDGPVKYSAAAEVRVVGP